VLGSIAYSTICLAAASAALVALAASTSKAALAAEERSEKGTDLFSPAPALKFARELTAASQPSK
jgi:hypothetical protein